jgi:hypothetical protein
VHSIWSSLREEVQRARDLDEARGVRK